MALPQHPAPAMLCAFLVALLFAEQTHADNSPAAPPVEELPPLPLAKIIPTLSFSNPFQRYSDGIIPGWKFGGTASLNNDYIILTPPSPNALGWVWSDTAASMVAWEADLEFHIGGSDTRGAGGGLAFWFTAEQGRAGPIYGQNDKFNGLGIFFDTYESQEKGEEPEPFVVAMMNYGESLLQGSDPDYFKNQVGVCFAGYRNLQHAARARIIRMADRLQVWLDLDNSGHFQNCLQTEPGDKRVRLPDTGYFGITASTGTHGDAHVVYRLSIAKLDDGEEVKSKPFHGHGSAVPAEHVVKSEGRHHETHVPIATHGPKLGDDGLPMRTASDEEADHAMVPPSVNSNVMLHEKLESVVDELLKVTNATSVTKEAVEHMAMEMRDHMSSELMEAFGLLAAEMHVMNKSIVEILEEQHAQTRMHKTEATGAAGMADKSLSKLHEDMTQLSASGKACTDAMGTLSSKQADTSNSVQRLEQALAAATKQFNDANTQITHLQTKLLDQMSSVSSLQAEIKGSQAKIEEQLAALQQEGGSTSNIPLVVSAQALVLAAFLFYQRIAQRRRDHFL